MNELLPTSMTGSQRLLLALLSFRPGTRRTAPEEVRWDDFVRLVGGLGLFPIMAYILQQDPSGVPDSVRDQILSCGRANALCQLRRHAALRRIAGALGEARIPLIILKGMALTYLAYPNPYCRFMSDIDLFVPEAELKRAVQLVRDLGFRDSHNVFRQDCSALVSSNGEVQIEIHGSLPSLDQFGMKSDGLWDRSLPADLGGVQVRVLCPEDCIQHLCLHIGAHHHYLSRLQELLDFRFYLEKHGSEIEWQTVADRSVQTGSSAWVYLTLWLAQELLGAPVPAGFFQSCPVPKRLAELSGLATHHLLSLPELPMTSSFVRVCAGSSFKERVDAFAAHWREGVSRAKDNVNPPKGRLLWLRDYSGLFFRRIKFFVRSGALRPSVWRAAAEYQASRARLLRFMDTEAQGVPPNGPGV